MTPNEITLKIRQAADVICHQGLIQFPVTDTAVAIIQNVVGNAEEELGLIEAFREQPSQTLAQLAESSGLPEDTIERLAASLASKGLVFNQPNSHGVMVYRLLPLMMVGLMEYRFMGALTGNTAEKELAELFENLLAELRDQTQTHYETLIPLFRSAPAIDRTIAARRTADGRDIRIIPVATPLTTNEEIILPSQRVEAIINKFEDIAVGHCFCRQRRALLGEPCGTHAPMQNCFSFGKSARHTSAQGFARKVTRGEALTILEQARQAGLIHKAFHPGSRESRPETSICNCCKDCCDTLRLWRDGTLPMINSTYHLAVIDPDACTGCGSCLQWCPTDAITLDDDGITRRRADACLGCGVCARFCPEAAISLQEGYRKVFILPPRLREPQPEPSAP